MNAFTCCMQQAYLRFPCVSLKSRRSVVARVDRCTRRSSCFCWPVALLRPTLQRRLRNRICDPCPGCTNGSSFHTPMLRCVCRTLCSASSTLATRSLCGSRNLRPYSSAPSRTVSRCTVSVLSIRLGCLPSQGTSGWWTTGWPFASFSMIHAGRHAAVSSLTSSSPLA